jgi:hypothetical protein
MIYSKKYINIILKLTCFFKNNKIISKYLISKIDDIYKNNLEWENAKLFVNEINNNLWSHLSVSETTKIFLKSELLTDKSNYSFAKIDSNNNIIIDTIFSFSTIKSYDYIIRKCYSKKYKSKTPFSQKFIDTMNFNSVNGNNVESFNNPFGIFKGFVWYYAASSLFEKSLINNIKDIKTTIEQLELEELKKTNEQPVNERLFSLRRVLKMINLKFSHI